MSDSRSIAVGGLVLTAVGLVTGGAFWWADREATPERRIDRCEASNDVADEQPATLAPGGVVYSGCTWPPMPGAEEDGYYEIQVESVSLMATRSLAEFPSSIDVLQTSCREVVVQYQDYSLSNGTRLPDLLPSRRIPVGFDQALDLSTGEVGGIDSALLEEAAAGGGGDVISGGAYVLNGKTDLVGASCVDPEDLS